MQYQDMIVQQNDKMQICVSVEKHVIDVWHHMCKECSILKDHLRYCLQIIGKYIMKLIGWIRNLKEYDEEHSIFSKRDKRDKRK